MQSLEALDYLALFRFTELKRASTGHIWIEVGTIFGQTSKSSADYAYFQRSDENSIRTEFKASKKGHREERKQTTRFLMVKKFPKDFHETS